MKESIKNDTRTTDNLADVNNQATLVEKRKVIAHGEKAKAKEIGGAKGLEPTRYGDWEAKGRCYDF